MTIRLTPFTFEELVKTITAATALAGLLLGIRNALQQRSTRQRQDEVELRQARARLEKVQDILGGQAFSSGAWMSSSPIASDDAERVANELREVAASEPTLYEQVQILRAQLLVRMRRHADAIRVLDDCLQRDSRSLEPLKARARVLLDKRDLVAALADCDTAIDAAPRDPKAHGLRSQVLWELGRYDESVDSVAKASELDPSDELYSTVMTLRCIVLERPVEVLCASARALNVNPYSEAANWARAQALHDMNDHAHALDACESALRYDPDNLDLMRLKAHTLFKTRKFEAALQAIDIAISRDRSHSDSHQIRARALAGLRRHSEALQSIDDALAHAPGSVAALADQGALLNEVGRYADAMRSYDTAIKAEPGDWMLRFNCGVVLRNLEQFSAAVSMYSSAIELKSDEPIVYERRASVLRFLGRCDEAVRDEATAKQLRDADPNRSKRDPYIDASGQHI